MVAVFKHELRMYFQSLTAYVFGAFLLVIVGIGAMLYNLQAAVSNFEYVLSFSSIIYAVIVPILTMRVIAEERRQKTDQLLYSLPISTFQVIMGKYAALLLVFVIPLCVIAIYPVIFAQFGEVYLPTSYGSLIAFFLMGAALIALGLFISSLSENQGFAAGIGVAAILLNYFSVTLSEYVSSTAIGSAVALFVLAAGLGLLIHYLTRNDDLACIVGLGLMAVTVDYSYTNDEDEEVSDTVVVSIARAPDDRATLETADSEDEETDDTSDITAYLRVGESQIIYKLSGDDFTTLMDASYDSLRHQQIFWGDFEDVTQIDITLEGESHTITSALKDDERVYSYNGSEIDLTDFTTALENLTADSFTSAAATGQEEISLTLHLDNEDFPTVNIQITRYDGFLCLAAVDGESVSLVNRSDAMDLVEAVQSIVLGQSE